jgi:hypothetical protein
LLGDRVVRYFDVIASKLFDPKIELTHNYFTNNCQQFCARILDFRTFGSFLATTPACRSHIPKNPLYLVSFVCPPGSYDSPRRIRPRTKNQAPNGLTEEYILRFRCHGHHDESDHIDTLREYWNDWGAFGGPLYKHQDLFPWDCTEAYRKGEAGSNIKCNDCTITKHIWSYPFDAWSIAQLHIYREKSLYSPPHSSGNKVLTDAEWMRNRLDVLSALKALTIVTVSMAKTTSFRTSCRWNRERRALTPDTATRLDRIKLSGIYRAQPYSHSFEQTKYHDCTLAAWALLSRQDQIKEYEKLRDYRAEELTEILPRPQPRGNQYRFRHEMHRGETTGSDANWVDQEHHKHQHKHELHSDSDTVVPSDFEEEDFDEEHGFHLRGELLPGGFWADPEDGEELYDSEGDSFGPDIHDHNQGTGPCDYDKDDHWIDTSYYIDEPSEADITKAMRDSRIVDEFLAAGVPLWMIDPSSINPDNPDPSSILRSLDDSAYRWNNDSDDSVSDYYGASDGYWGNDNSSGSSNSWYGGGSSGGWGSSNNSSSNNGGSSWD